MAYLIYLMVYNLLLMAQYAHFLVNLPKLLVSHFKQLSLIIRRIWFIIGSNF